MISLDTAGLKRGDEGLDPCSFYPIMQHSVPSAAGQVPDFSLRYIKSENIQKKNMKSNINDGDSEVSFVDNYLLYILAQASDTLSREFHAQLASLGVSVPKWRILASLYPNKSLNVGELAQKCIMKQPTLTRQLDRLCEEGVTHRIHETEDRRGVLVSLTEQGREEAARYVTMAKAHEERLLHSYSEAEIARLKGVLSLFVDTRDA